MIAFFDGLSIVVRVATAFGLALVVAVVAYRAKALDRDGCVAAVAVGTLTLGFGGVAAGAALLAFFLTGSLLSKLPRRSGVSAAASLGVKDARRDAAQVLANGGVGAICAVTSGIMAMLHAKLAPAWLAASIAAFAAAAGDTWASEIGERFGGRPRSIIGLQPASPGASGAVTLAGTVASIAGGAVVGALVAAVTSTPASFIVAAIAGGAGSLIDSVLGASIQGVWSCAVCAQTVEAPVHHGEPGEHARGLRWMTNDMVNLFATLSAAALALAAGLLWTI